MLCLRRLAVDFVSPVQQLLRYPARLVWRESHSHVGRVGDAYPGADLQADEAGVVVDVDLLADRDGWP